MDAGEETPRPDQSTEDTQREAKKARWQKLMTAKRRPPRIDFSPPRWVKSGYNMQTGEDSEKKQRARIVGAAIREQLKRVNRYTPYIEFNDENVGLEKPVEVVLPRSNKPPVEYCMSDEFIQHLDRQAKLYFSRVKQPSRKEIVANGLEYMTQEAFSAFTDYLAEKNLLQEHAKVYTHYNFTVEMKKNDEDCWTSNLYFAEAMLMDGFKYYFCSPLELTDDGPQQHSYEFCCDTAGDCYACKNQGVNELKHPPGEGYQKGHEGSGFCYMNADSSDEEICM
ncbi:hypothetical protein ACP70R_025689 [Stipagrostis hirtigluma subsp. patula]